MSRSVAGSGRRLMSARFVLKTDAPANFVIHNLGGLYADRDALSRRRAGVTDIYGATVAKRRLARKLTELRLKNGYTANQVCDKLNWGRGKVGRFEANVR